MSIVVNVVSVVAENYMSNFKIEIDGFDPGYLGKLAKMLIPMLKSQKKWVIVSEIAEDPILFVEAVAALGSRGYFDDESGHIRVEFGKDNAAIRYVTDREINFMYSKLKTCKK